jgi:hypothetical protein
VSLSNLIIGANPVEPRATSSPSRRHGKLGVADGPSSVDEWRTNINLANEPEAQPAAAESSQDEVDTSTTENLPGSNEATQSEDISISIRSSGELGSTSNDDSSSGARKKNKKRDKRAENSKQMGYDGTSDQGTSSADITSSGDSPYDTSSWETDQPKGKAKKQAKPQKSKFSNRSDATSESAPVEDTHSSNPVSSSEIARTG